MQKRAFAGVLVLFAVLLFAAIATHLTFERDTILQQARAEAETRSGALAAYTEQTVAGLDLALLGLSQTLPALMGDGAASSPTIAARLAERQVSSPATEAFFALDANGRLIATSAGPATVPADLSGLPGFLFHRGATQDALHIGRARQDLTAVADGPWVVDVTRRVSAPGGGFAGIVGAALSLDSLIAFQQTLMDGSGGRAGVIASDGTVLIRAPFDAAVYGQNVTQGPLFRELAAADRGVYVAPSETDGVSRITAFERLDRFPLITYVALSEQERMARWWTLLVAEVALALVLIGLLALILRRALRTSGPARDGEAQQTLSKGLAEGVAGLVRASSPAEVLSGIEASSKRLANAGSSRAQLFAPGTNPDLPSGSENRIVVPISGVNGGAIGSLEVGSRLGGGTFGDVDRWVVRQLADVGGAMIDRQQTGSAHDAALAEAQAARAEVEQVYSSITDTVARFDPEWRVLYVNANAKALTGMAPEAMLGKPLWELFPHLVGTPFETEVRRAASSGEPAIFEFELPQLRRWYAARAYPGDSGTTVYLKDITARKNTESQLRQAQRMEAVGQLTGGVAHDFNNLLTVILGNIDDLIAAPNIPAELEGQAHMALKAAERASDLTQRLLAFSRRQALDPRAVDVIKLLENLEDLVRRTTGAAVDVVFMPARELHLAMVDAAQLESAVLNLVINAQHAMPDGGKLTIETQDVYLDGEYASAHNEVREGQYVMVSVADTGIGMSPDTIERVFEPFFTTKPAGIGTGLGLSMIYGFIKQSRGHISIYSELGQGTIIKMYLPGPKMAMPK